MPTFTQIELVSEREPPEGEPDDVFIAVDVQLDLPPHSVEWLQKHLGQWLKHINREDPTPLSNYAWRMTREDPNSEFPGELTIPVLDGRLVESVDWQLCAFRPQSAPTSGGDAVPARADFALRGVISCGSRKAALTLRNALAPTGDPPIQRPLEASIVLPGDDAPTPVTAGVYACLDYLDVFEFEDEGPATFWQRHDYDGIPVIIAAWSRFDSPSRTWIMLREDVVAKFGSADFGAVSRMIEPDLQQGRKTLVSDRGIFILVNEV